MTGLAPWTGASAGDWLPDRRPVSLNGFLTNLRRRFLDRFYTKVLTTIEFRPPTVPHPELQTCRSDAMVPSPASFAFGFQRPGLIFPLAPVACDNR